jgi:pantoate--beta-alanine ligase
LHRGHLELVSAAGEHDAVPCHYSDYLSKAAACEKVVVSVYVNPTQFGPNEDFNRYPRDLEKDLQMLATLNLDASRLAVFAPHNVYTPNHFIYVEPTGLESNGEGMCRPGHFRGVATVVLKLFNIVRPTKAFFGQKVCPLCIVFFSHQIFATGRTAVHCREGTCGGFEHAPPHASGHLPHQPCR